MSKFDLKLSLSISGFLIFSPISILAFPIIVKYNNKSSSILELTLYGTMLTFFTFLTYLLGIALQKLLVAKSCSNIYIVNYFIILLVGLARGVFFYQLVNYLGLNQPSSIVPRITNSALTTIFFLTISNKIVEVIKTYKDRYLTLASQVAASTRITTDELSASEISYLDQIGENLDRHVREFLIARDAISSQALSEAIVTQINAEIKPISQRIWIESLDEMPNYNYLRLLRDASYNLNFSLRTLLIFLGTAGLLENIYAHTFQETVIRVISYLAAILTLTAMYRKWNPGFRYRRSILGVYLILLGIIPVYLNDFFARIFNFESANQIALLIIPLAPIMAILLSAVNLANSDRQMMLLTLKQFREQNRIQISRKNFATYLHNSLQSQLLALSVQLKNVQSNGESGPDRELQQSVEDFFNRSLTEDYLKFSHSTSTRLASLVRAWKGVMEIELDIDEVIWQDPVRHIVLLRFIEEMATNAYRKGRAHTLHIQVRVVKDEYEVVVNSSGESVGDSSTGIGQMWLDEMTMRPWVTEHLPNGTRLTMQL